ncbi:hypothetical protein K457DRAFT_16095 [Linnemannia elongata AG-77]|uniref:Uncharacterized protein n=1 Tax=Linnemannia elongata AG-77 TaxID=1314771 RepID=A0A197K4X3_9FUNG|nr:hypothetical protein K457DRAFT_16095 [Linnemannia elongata AG-77]
MEPAKDRTPFNITELRHRVSLFATVKDALSCALVFKTWARDYLPVIWSQVDFDSEPQFANLTTKTIIKHGKFIQIVKNAMALPMITVLVNGGVNRLKDHHIETTAFRCSIYALMRSSLGTAAPRCPSSNWSERTLSDLQPYPCSTRALKFFGRPSRAFSQSVERAILAIAIPELDIALYLGHSRCHHPQVSQQHFPCNGNNNNISKITSNYEYTTVEALTAIYLHQASLKSAVAYYREYHVDIEREEIIPVLDHFRISGHHLQLTPRSCLKPQVIDLHYHKMDMDVVEQGGWVCKNLIILPIRIKVLDTRAWTQRQDP